MTVAVAVGRAVSRVGRALSDGWRQAASASKTTINNGEMALIGSGPYNACEILNNLLPITLLACGSFTYSPLYAKDMDSSRKAAICS